MKILVLGASGATGSLLIERLLKNNINTRIVVRNSAAVAEEIKENPFLEIIEGSIGEFTEQQMTELLNGCTAAVSCLGHNVSFKGMYGKPRYLVADTVRKLYSTAAKTGNGKFRFVLMSTTAYTNFRNGEKLSAGEKIVFSLLNVILPPHRDNVAAANYLIDKAGENERLEWVAVRPDGLTDDKDEKEYIVFDSRQSSPIFNPGKTTRNDVSRFMTALLTDESLWEKWKFKTPVLYTETAE